MRRLRPLAGLAGRISLVSMLVALVAIGVIAVGVLVFAKATFDHLMAQAGASAEVANSMFDHGVVTIFTATAVIAGLISVLLAIILATRLARPLDEIAHAARRIAGGDYSARVPRRGPEEFSSLADSFNQMAESLAEQERARREFIVNAAHELRTPLTNLQGYLEALRDGVIEPTTEQFASLHEEADRLVRLSRSLDTLADDRPQGALTLPPLDLTQALRSAVELTRPLLDARAIGVGLHSPEELCARANPDHLAQVLANLLQNASRYTPPGGRVAIAAEARRADVLVSITNTGDGIPAQDLPHVFERFYRVEKSRDSARGGAGIGLAIVKQLVESAGGEVGADSQRGATCFWFSLPA